MGNIRKRKRTAINPDIIDQGFNAALPADRDDCEEGVPSSVLNRASGNWRKLLSYLRCPVGSPERNEAETVLASLNIEYQDGPYNSRTFYEKV